MTRVVHVLVWLALAVVLVVNVASAYVRLAQQGLGCVPWPQCYGQTAPQDAGAVPSEASPHFYVRAVHRFSASIAAVLLVTIAFLGWGRWAGRGPRVGAITLLVLAGGLTWLGIRTPSAAPAVTLGNVLGGMAMIAALAWLAAWQPRASGPARVGWVAWTALALVTLQLALGALVNARYAAGACIGLPDCAGSWWPQGAPASAFDIFRPTDVPIAASEAAARQAVHMAHRLVGLATAVGVAAVVLGVLRRRDGPRVAAAFLAALLAAQLALGAQMVEAGAPLAAATLHNMLANLLVATLAWIVCRGTRDARGKEQR